MLCGATCPPSARASFHNSKALITRFLYRGVSRVGSGHSRTATLSFPNRMDNLDVRLRKVSGRYWQTDPGYGVAKKTRFRRRFLPPPPICTMRICVLPRSDSELTVGGVSADGQRRARPVAYLRMGLSGSAPEPKNE